MWVAERFGDIPRREWSMFGCWSWQPRVCCTTESNWLEWRGNWWVGSRCGRGTATEKCRHGPVLPKRVRCSFSHRWLQLRRPQSLLLLSFREIILDIAQFGNPAVSQHFGFLHHCMPRVNFQQWYCCCCCWPSVERVLLPASSCLLSSTLRRHLPELVGDVLPRGIPILQWFIITVRKLMNAGSSRVGISNGQNHRATLSFFLLLLPKNVRGGGDLEQET